MNRMMKICLLNQNSHLCLSSYSLLIFAHSFIASFIYHFSCLLTLSFPSFLANAFNTHSFCMFFCLSFCVLRLNFGFVYAVVSAIFLIFPVLSSLYSCLSLLTLITSFTCLLFIIIALYLFLPLFPFLLFVFVLSPCLFVPFFELSHPLVRCCFFLVDSPQPFTLNLFIYLLYYLFYYSLYYIAHWPNPLIQETLILLIGSKSEVHLNVAWGFWGLIRFTQGSAVIKTIAMNNCKENNILI